MTEERINIWNAAGKPGLVLGVVSILYMVINHFIGKIAATGSVAIIVGFANFLLWAGKLFLCIWLMRTFMLGFSAAHKSADNNKVFRFGVVVALLSAIVFSAFNLVYMLYIAPEILSESFDLVMQQYAGRFSASEMESLSNMQADLPRFTFIINFIWCFLFGTILSAIFSRKIPSDLNNPFNAPGQ